MAYHSVLLRQMRKLGVRPERAPEGEAWQGFLERIDHFYKDCDQDRYTFERTLAVCSDEMLGLNHQLQEAVDQIRLLHRSEREQAEARVAAERAGFQVRLEHAQKMESLGNLAAGIAHDMNNVLGAILGIASANLEGQPEGSSARKAFGTIVKAADRGGKMVRSLLGYVRSTPEQMERVAFNDLLREQAQLLERSTLANVSLILDLEPALRPIRGDAGALGHAIMNLCVNAVDAMPERGTVTIRSLNLEDGQVEIQIQDTGTGMPQAVLERALEPFYTTKGPGKGTGLGLSMVFTTVKTHQGQMEIDSEAGRGTLVKLRFPAWPEAGEPGPIPETETDPPMGALRILLVDDDAMVLETCIEMLATLGHRPTAAANAEQGLRLLEAGLEVDLVMLDLNMPGLGGTGLLDGLRTWRPNLPVLVISGRADQATLTVLEELPQVALLPKPFSMRQLHHHLQRVWRSRNPG